MNGKLVILSGPSGVGKDTVIDEWHKVNQMVERVVATTTRPPRPGETNGIDYDFVSRELFDESAKNGEFLEFKNVHSNWYATPKKSVDKLLEEGKIAILKIDVQGAVTVMELRTDAITIFLLPPSEDDLDRRIRGRGADSEETIELRLQNARGEIALSNRYQHKVVNDNLQETVRTLQEIVSK